MMPQIVEFAGGRGASPSIATSSNDASSCRDACGDTGEWGCGVWKVVRAVPTWYGVDEASHVAGVCSRCRAPASVIADQRGVMACSDTRPLCGLYWYPTRGRVVGAVTLPGAELRRRWRVESHSRPWCGLR